MQKARKRQHEAHQPKLLRALLGWSTWKPGRRTLIVYLKATGRFPSDEKNNRSWPT